VANAILDGTDALMLSEETAMGAYPIHAVNILSRIAVATERHLQDPSFSTATVLEQLPITASAMSHSACLMAEDLRAAVIVAATTSGSTVRLVARFRPSCPIVGMTPRSDIQRQLTLSWGVTPAYVESFSNADDIFSLASSWVQEKGLANRGDRVIVTAGVPVGKPGATNLLKVLKID
jgi:pyruvate kinase